MLPSNLIPYSELKSLSSLQCFFPLAPCFLIAFSSFSSFLLNCAKECLAGLGFFLPFLAAHTSDFSILSFSYLRQSFVLCMVHVPPCFLQRLQCFLEWTFFRNLSVDSGPGCLFPFLPSLEAFLLDCALDFSCVHTRSIALRDIRSKRMSMGVIPFLWRLNWSCHISGHTQRIWLARSVSANGTTMGIVLGLALGL